MSKFNLSIVSFGVAFSASAFGFEWKDCNKDIKNYCPKAKGDAEIFECLEKNEKVLSKSCYETHEKYERESGKTDGDDK